ncbi:Putative NADH-flavin reductase [Amycolatopsis xylanica]|uniref:Putative NADH-flavin reductase n=1 Tax=Amycolatopsis xylanica TaxID=589385 RepID=A0A1H2ZK25_9PSEU|nr:NAD(P)-binding oxidoreductase [Amycolatopsis xylanica]SDX17308.1 Putative NADH-flavin reductase [Amycolatopsis xylanica]
MKLTILGATGGVGTHLVRQALEADHHVTAVVRDPAKLAVEPQVRLEVVIAKELDPSALAPAITGRDAVVSALGARDRRPTTVCADGARATIAAMRDADVRRLVVVSASGLTTEGDGVFTRTLVKPLLGSVLKESFRDMREMEELVRASELAWTIVRPPRLTDGGRTGRIRSRADGNVRGSFSITRADVADYLLRTVADDSLVKGTISIAHG